VRPPHLVYYRATPQGQLVESAVIDTLECSMHHDFAITERHVVFLDSCWLFDWSSLAMGSPWRWRDGRARIGVMERDAPGSTQWFDIADCHLSHAANAYDDGDTVVLTGTRIDAPTALPVLHEWRIDLVRRTVRERPLDDISVEYPRVPDSSVGRSTDATYVSGFFYEAEPDHGEIHRYEDGGRRVTHRFPVGHTCGEPVPVASYLLTFAHDRPNGTSYLAILDAHDVAASPLACCRLLH
jgi:carotenoid cleavage dioxygenase-like enzyme